MASLAELIAGVRLCLDYPLPGILTDEKILDKISDASQLMLLEAQNTGISWNVNKFDLQVGAGQPDFGYLLPAPDFAKDIIVRTVDPTDPFHVSREIQRVDPQDVDQYYSGPEQNTGGIGAPTHSAVCVTVHRYGAGAYMKFFPSPSATCQYRIWYQTGFFPSQDLNTEPFLPPFHAYLKLRAALSCLPKCKWQGMSNEENAELRQDLALGLGPDLQGYSHAFEVWITSDRIESVSKRVGFGDRYEKTDYGYWSDGVVGTTAASLPPVPPVELDLLLLNDGTTILTLNDGTSGLNLT